MTIGTKIEWFGIHQTFDRKICIIFGWWRMFAQYLGVLRERFFFFQNQNMTLLQHFLDRELRVEPIKKNILTISSDILGNLKNMTIMIMSKKKKSYINSYYKLILRAYCLLIYSRSCRESEKLKLFIGIDTPKNKSRWDI